MTGRAHLWRQVWKESRALLPIWAGSALVLLAAKVVGGRRVLDLAALSYAVGTLALSAHLFGQEYTYRTLGGLLSQPVDRRRTLIIKYAVLAAMVLTLSALCWFTSIPASPFRSFVVSWMLVLPALTLTPWLTMIGRNTLAGVVLTISVVGYIQTADRLALVYHLASFPTPQSLTIALAALAPVLTWFTFMRLEAIEGRGTEVHLPRWFRVAPRPARRHVLWLIAIKEFRLQQLTFATVVFYVMGWTGMSLYNQQVSDPHRHIPVAAVTMVYLMLLSVVIGALASAEERRGGTLEWHLLLPMPAWQQWTVKATIAIALALLLGGVLPQLLFGIAGSARLPMLVLAVVCTSFSLYLSSLCASGVWAMVMWLPVVGGAVMFFQLVERVVEGLLPTAYPTLALTPWFISAGGFVALFLVFGFRNHRLVDRSVMRVAQQAAAIAAFLVVSVVLVMRW